MNGSAIDLATEDMLAFVASAIGEKKKVLEVGAGKGHLARRMREAGYEVLAIDPRVQGDGVALGTFPAYETSDRFDAVLFTRSLHHIDALEQAVDRARALLVPGGSIIVDEFAWEDVDLPTAAWAYGALAVVDGDHWKDDGDPLAAWMKRYREEHHIHESRAIVRELEKHFTVVSGRGPYFWRYLPDDAPDLTAELVRQTENELGAGGVIKLIGVRMVAR